MSGNVELMAMVQTDDGPRPVKILLDGSARMAGLASAAMRAVALQHPHYAAKPIVALTYSVRANT